MYQERLLSLKLFIRRLNILKNEKIWRKAISKVKSKKTLTDFSGMEQESVRDKSPLRFSGEREPYG